MKTVFLSAFLRFFIFLSLCSKKSSYNTLQLGSKYDILILNNEYLYPFSERNPVPDGAMENFRIRLAGKTIEITCVSEYVLKRCGDYLTSGDADYSVTVTEEDIEKERLVCGKSVRGASGGQPPIPDREIEFLAVYRKIAALLLEDSVILFHGSVVAVDGNAYCFAAKSGTGKSTHTRLWREFLGDRAVMVNDDKPLFTVSENGVVAHGTPWNGKHHLASNISVPLKAICLLERSSVNAIEPITFDEAYPMLYQQTHRPADPEKLMKTLRLLDKMNGKVSFYRLKCNTDPEAAELSYQGMK